MLGLGTTVQAVPSQCSTRVCSIPPPLDVAVPTAQASFAARVVTAVTPLVGLKTWLQALPFQCKIESPLTAQTSSAAWAATPYSRAPPERPGAAIAVQVVPFQWSRSGMPPPPTAQTSFAGTMATP